MIIKTITLSLLAAVAFAAPKEKSNFDPKKIPAQNFPAPELDEVGYLTNAEISEMVEGFKKSGRKPSSSSAKVATQDLISPQMAAFREKIVAAKTGEEFYKIISDENAKYKDIPESANDLKYTVARMATWLPLRGVVWKATPVVHKVLVTQQALLASIRNLAEQGMINFPDSHIQAQMMFLSMPVLNEAGQDFVPRFYSEADFMTFLGTKVYSSMQQAIVRLEALRMVNVGLKGKGKETPIVFDSRIRFGEQMNTEAYDAFDRYKVVGEAEKFAAIARMHRRMAAIASSVAYDWREHFELRREIGKEFGMGIAEANLIDTTNRILPGKDIVGSEFVNGATRKSRTEIIMKPKYQGLYKLVTTNGHGKRWMATSYFHLHKSAVYLDKTWEQVKNEPMDYVMQLDPEIFTARKEQVEMGLLNINKLVGKCNADPKKNTCDPSLSGADVIIGSLSGDKLPVNFKGFYDNPPESLRSLLPTNFSENDDLEPLKGFSFYKTMKPVSQKKPDVFTVNIGGKKTEFRNYMFDRATEWNPNQKEGYGTIFPGVSKTGVADAMRIINETRGARMLNNAFSMFIR